MVKALTERAKLVGTAPPTENPVANKLLRLLLRLSPEEPALTLICPKGRSELPTSATSEMAPVVVNVSACAPLEVPEIVLGKERAPGVESIVAELPVKVTGDAVVMPNEVQLILPPIFTAFAVVFALTIEKAANRLIPPTTPPKVIAPEVPAVRVSPCVLAAAPSIVALEPENKISAPPGAPLVVSIDVVD